MFFWPMFLKALEKCVLKFFNQTLQNFFYSLDQLGNVKLELLPDFDMLLMVEKGIRSGICHSINRYPKANNKYINDYDKNKDFSYLKYWDVNNLCGLAMSQKLLVHCFEQTEDISEFNEGFIESYSEESDEGYFHLRG